MARISSRVPSSRATEINVQSRYPEGMLVSKVGYHSWLSVFTPTALTIKAADLSRLIFCTRVFFWLVTTTAIVRAQAMVRTAPKLVAAVPRELRGACLTSVSIAGLLDQLLGSEPSPSK